MLTFIVSEARLQNSALAPSTLATGQTEQEPNLPALALADMYEALGSTELAPSCTTL